MKNHGCCDLKYAKKLKKLGVKQESLWYYNSKTMKLQKGFTSHADIEGFCRWSTSAFTVAELGEMLPKWIYTIRLDYKPYDKCWCVLDKGGRIEITADTEANARCLMLIYLLEKGITNV